MVGDARPEVIVYRNRQWRTGKYELELLGLTLSGERLFLVPLEQSEFRRLECLFNRPRFPQKGVLVLETFLANDGCSLHRYDRAWEGFVPSARSPKGLGVQAGDRRTYAASAAGDAFLLVRTERGLNVPREVLEGR